MTQFSRMAKARRWSRDRLYAGRAAAAALSLALAVTLARATPGLSVDWRGLQRWARRARSTTPRRCSTCCCWCRAGIAAALRAAPVLAGRRSSESAASLLIELTQGLLGNGTCHCDDLVRNLAGAVIGAGLGVVLANVYGSTDR